MKNPTSSFGKKLGTMVLDKITRHNNLAVLNTQFDGTKVSAASPPALIILILTLNNHAADQVGLWACGGAGQYTG